MRPETEEWIKKAEADFHTAQREVSVTESPNYDAVCFHAQQCVEKYMKARLIEHAIPFPKIHDLEALLNLLIPVASELESFRDDIRRLTDMAVEVRYPGYSSDLLDAEEAFRTAGIIRTEMRKHFRLVE